MTYNTCETCGADNGRAGNLVNGMCANCRDTKKLQSYVIHTHLPRTDEEIKKMLDALILTK
jgi:hypothetical protein